MWRMIRWSWVCAGCFALLLGCGGQEVVVDEVVVVTPVAAVAVGGSSSLEGVNGGSRIEPIVIEPVVSPMPELETAAYGEINEWGEVFPPAGWLVAEGVHELLLAYQPLDRPLENQLGSYVSVAQWENQIGERGWLASFPDGEEEVDGHYRFRVADRVWQGVFLRGTVDGYRAFWAYTNEGARYSYTLIVYLPVDEDVGLADGWLAIAPDVNVILKRLVIVEEGV